jgi:hypothetical protein
VGYPLVLLKEVFHIPLTTLFTWFNYLALIGVVLTFYFVFSRTFNKQAGLMAAIGIFAMQTFVAQYLSGLIFNIINIGIILMWFFYFGIRAWTKRSWIYGVIAVALLFLFANFHSSGLYLPIMPHSILRRLTDEVEVYSSCFATGCAPHRDRCLSTILGGFRRENLIENRTG